MIRRLLPLYLLLAFTRPADVDPVVAKVAQRPLNVPTGNGDFRSIVLHAEGRTLVAQIEIAPDMASVVTADMLGSVFASSVCADPRNRTFFTQGRNLRLELRAGTGDPQIASVDRCPIPAGGGVTTASFAQAMQAFIGRESDAVRIAGIRAEGETVVFELDGFVGWRRGLTAEMLEVPLLENFCDQASGINSFFNGVRGIRLDTLEAGQQRVQGRRIIACPVRR